MLHIDYSLTLDDLQNKLKRFWQLSGEKIHAIQNEYDDSQGSPVYTVKGKYTARGWTEWTQGFQYGSALLQFDTDGDEHFLDIGRQGTLDKMAVHVSHTGVHDHGFNNLSTYGNALRLMREEKILFDEWEKNFYELALKISGAVQASRWTSLPNGGFIHSFNGPHSLFVDTIRSCRILSVAHILGHTLRGENDANINLLERMLQHAKVTADYSVFYGTGRDAQDVRGRTAHECIFNTRNGQFRCPNAQQGFSGYTTWTRGLSWAMCGFPEELEFLDTLPEVELEPFGGRQDIEAFMLKAAQAVCDFYIENTPTDGIPYWDTGAPNLHKLGDYLGRPAEPFNDFEPVDSSAAAIGAQGLLRLGHYLHKKGETKDGSRYWQAGLAVLNTLLQEPYLSVDPRHHGLLLHTIYHQPNGWDYIPTGSRIPNSESCMWGDYHLRECALYVQKLISNEPYYTFFGCVHD